MSNETRLIDTHAHVATAQFDADRADVLARAADAGVTRIIEIGYDLESSRAAVALAEAHPQIYAVVGLQPNHVHQAPEGWEGELRALAARPKVVGIGEIGLDYHWMAAPPDLQERFFRDQLAIARELGLPVVIHSREAQHDTLRILGDAARDQPGIMHSFSGGWAYAQACLEIGFLLSFSGPLTFPKASDLHEAARLAPLEMLLTETDSPYLSPHPHRGKRNEPARVRLVAERLAALRGLPLDAVADQIWRNAERVFSFYRMA
jgi:TatD DNase family protein